MKKTIGTSSTAIVIFNNILSLFVVKIHNQNLTFLTSIDIMRYH